MAIYIPEVFKDALATEFVGKLKLGALATQIVGFAGQPGGTINLPYFNYVGDAAIIAAGDAAVPAVMSGSSIKAVIKKAVTAIPMTDEDATQGAGDPIGQVRLQLAQGLAGAIDNDLMTALLTTTLSVGAGAAVITKDNMIDALALLGDDTEGTVLMIHSKQLADIYKDANFIKASELGGPIMIGGIAAIGQFYGMPVIVTDRVKKSDGNVYSAVAFKADALVLAYKREVQVEDSRVALNGATNYVANVHFATALAKPTKAVKILTL